MSGGGHGGGGKRRKKGGHGAAHADERWLLTYADMITLLLALFIVLFAMSTIDAVKFKALSTTLSETFNGQVFNAGKDTLPGSQGVLEPTAMAQRPNPSAFDVKSNANSRGGAKSKAVQKELQATVGKQKRTGVEVTQTERGIVIRLAGDVMFASGSAQLVPEGIKVIDKLSAQIAASEYDIAVEGHTDGAPIATGTYPTNWSLGGARAETVLMLLIKDGVATKRLRFGSYADTRPLVRPDFPEQSVARNRRVEIVLLSPKSSSARVDSSDVDDTQSDVQIAGGDPAGAGGSEGSDDGAAPEHDSPSDPAGIGPIVPSIIDLTSG